ncbi:MAG: MoaD/ThiS family protein, partial [Anaerolineales bacterium]
MIIQVKLFAMLTRYHPETPAGIPFKIELPENATIQNLLEILQIPPEETKITFVNNQIQNLDYPLKEGDVVGIFPPVAGGEK